MKKFINKFIRLYLGEFGSGKTYSLINVVLRGDDQNV